MKKTSIIFFILLSFSSHFTNAADKAAVIQAATPSAVGLNTSQHLITVLIALLGIIALIFIFAWFARRFNGGSWLKASHIKVLSTLPLGTRERLLLVEVGQEQLLLGVTANSISTLHTLKNPIEVTTPQPSSEFAEKLLRMIDRNNDSVNSKNEVVDNEK